MLRIGIAAKISHTRNTNAHYGSQPPSKAPQRDGTIKVRMSTYHYVIFSDTPTRAPCCVISIKKKYAYLFLDTETIPTLMYHLP